LTEKLQNFVDSGKYDDIITLNITFLEVPIMDSIIGKGISGKYYFYFSWGYFYFSAGYLFCKNIYASLYNEFNKFKFRQAVNFC